MLSQLCRALQANSNSQIQQTFTLPNTMYNAPAYASGYMYVQPNQSPVLAYPVSSDLLPPHGSRPHLYGAHVSFTYEPSHRP